MSICLDIIIYMTAVLICYKLRVYISLLWHNKYDNKDVKQTNDTDIVIFVPNDNVLKNFDKLTKEEAKEDSYPLDTLLSVLKSTKKSLDICVYTLSVTKIVKQCIELSKTGVKVRIIIGEPKVRTDNISFAYRLTNDLKIEKQAIMSLRSAGICVRMFNMHIGYMHNKFAVVDNRLLINGSFNWTKGGIKHNFEDMVITSDRQLVAIYSDKFNQLWTLSGKNISSHFNLE